MIEYPWLDSLWKQWKVMLASHATPHAMLCSANAGTGIEVLINKLASALVCKNSDDESCGFCHSCELSQSGHHPDIHWVRPEKQGKTINVEQIREVNRYAMESSQLGGKRIIIIQPAETMNESASNALLKTLETPPEQCVFMLLTQDKHKLLPTIISRCQHWQLPLISKSTLLEWLHLQAPKAKDINWFSLKMYAQSPVDALAFLQSNKQQEWEKLLGLILAGVSTDQFSLTDIQAFFKNDPVEKLNWLLYLFSDIQKMHFGIADPEHPQILDQLANHISYDKAYEKYLHLQQMLHSLNSSNGLNAELLIVDWYLSLLGTKL